MPIVKVSHSSVYIGAIYCCSFDFPIRLKQVFADNAVIMHYTAKSSAARNKARHDMYETTSTEKRKSQSPEEHPRHPQLLHSISFWSSFSCARGTRQMHVLLKFVSFV